MEEIKGYPKYQYSEFKKNGKDSQIVIRSDSFVEFKKMMEELNTLTAHRYDNRVDKPTVEAPKGEDCPICHSEVYINEGIIAEGKKNAGNPWKMKKCKKDKNHVVWWDFNLNGWSGL